MTEQPFDQPFEAEPFDPDHAHFTDDVEGLEEDGSHVVSTDGKELLAGGEE